MPWTAGIFDFGFLMYDTSSYISVGDSVGPAETIGFHAGYESYGVIGSSFFKYKFFDQNNSAHSNYFIIEFTISASSGIEENSTSPVKIFPNPGNGGFKIYNSIKTGNVVEIFNSHGER